MSPQFLKGMKPRLCLLGAKIYAASGDDHYIGWLLFKTTFYGSHL